MNALSCSPRWHVFGLAALATLATLAACDDSEDSTMDPDAAASDNGGNSTMDLDAAASGDSTTVLDAATSEGGANDLMVDGMMPAQTVPTEAVALKAFLTSKSYMSFKAEAAVHASPVHGRVRTFVNDVLAMSWAQNQMMHPLGAASVKELYSGNKLIGWAVLVKTALDKGAQNYFWYEIINDNVVANGNNATLCSGCHSGGNDYVLTPAF